MNLLPVLAQAGESPGAQGIAALVASLGGGGFALWFAWYAITTVIPRMQDQHREHVKEIVTEFRDESKESRDLYREECRTNRETTSRLAETVDGLAKRVNCPTSRFSPPPSAGS